MIDLHDRSGSTLGHDREWKYVGYTSDLAKRLKVHENGDLGLHAGRSGSLTPLTKSGPQRFRDRFRSEAEAMAYEMYIAADLERQGFRRQARISGGLGLLAPQMFVVTHWPRLGQQTLPDGSVDLPGCAPRS